MLAMVCESTFPSSKMHEHVARARRVATASPHASVHWCLHRQRGNVAHLRWLTFFDLPESGALPETTDSLQGEREAGATRTMNEREIRVRHYAVHARSARDPCFVPRQNMVARWWNGTVPAEKSAAYLRYLDGFGIQDYEKFRGHRAAVLLRQSDAQCVRLVFLSIWDSREDIAAYAGIDIERPHYYAFDLECLIKPQPRVEHFDVLEATGLLLGGS